MSSVRLPRLAVITHLNQALVKAKADLKACPTGEQRHRDERLRGVPVKRLVMCLIAMALLAIDLPAQAAPDTVPTLTAQATAVLPALDTMPRTVADLVARSGIAEPVVRAGLANLWARREVRYRLIPLADGSRTPSGQPRRERAYYVNRMPQASGRPSPRRR